MLPNDQQLGDEGVASHRKLEDKHGEILVERHMQLILIYSSCHLKDKTE